MKERVLVFVLMLFSVFHALGQFNDSTNYYIRESSTGVINRTNDGNSFVLNNSLKFSVYRKNLSLNSNNIWIYGEQQEGLVTNNDFLANIDADLFKSDRHIYYWGLVNYERSVSLKINNRFQGGLGIGYYIIDRKSVLLQVSDGILYEASDLYEQEGLDQSNYETYRNSFRIKFRILIKDIVTIEGVNFLQNSLRERDDYIIRSNTNMSVKLYKWLSFTINVAYNKLNETRRENFLLNYGLTVEKYF